MALKPGWNAKACPLAVIEPPLRCWICHRAGVRLYRPYGNFYRYRDNRCNLHVPEDERGWYVPLRTDLDGSIWGHCAGDQRSIDEFLSKPEASGSAVGWNVNDWSEPKK